MVHILDFHIHSKYSRACSKNLELPNIAKACETKGITIVGTGDFTHPKWFAHCKELLHETSAGVFSLKNNQSPTRFILSTELSCIYSQGGATRRVHLIVLAPSFDAVAALQTALEARGCNIRSDGRPILGLSAKELLKIILDISPDFEMIPAHAWTPWFAVFGSKSGFSSLHECFEELTPHIHAIETGLSSDPKMNWQLSSLDNLLLVSNSDAHGLENLGREANVMELERADYFEIINVIRTKNLKKFLYTIEFFPEEGKYHFDGHASCAFSCAPEETKKNNGECPKCKKQLVVGVLNRVAQLADREEGVTPSCGAPFKSIVPLKEIISAVIGIGKTSKKVQELYTKLIENCGNEFSILLDLPLADIVTIGGTHIAEGVRRVRASEIYVRPGYDGIYGVVSVLKPNETFGAMQMKMW